VGSVFTPIGNPQNLLVGLDAGFRGPAVVFLRYLAIPTAINLLLGGLYLRAVFRPRPGLAPSSPVAFPRLPWVPSGGWGPRLARHPVLAIFPVTMVGLVGLDLYTGVTGVSVLPSYEVALVGAAVVLLVSPARPALLRRVDWTILLLFAGLFVVVAGASPAASSPVSSGCSRSPARPPPRSRRSGASWGRASSARS
ncbi:citrate transporter, partial [mine drainage metagenome]